MLQAEVEVERLDQLKASKMKEISLKRQTELEEIFANAHSEIDSEATQEKIMALIDSGHVDPSELLANMDNRIIKANENDKFYDRTKKKTSNQKGGESQSIETANTPLDKKDAIITEMEENKKLLLEEKDKIASENEVITDAGDALDAYMSDLSSQLGEPFYCDDDEFYDRTKKKTSNQKGGESQSIETADTLLDKKDAIITEMEEKKKLLLEEKDSIASENEVLTDARDALDAYMSDLSSQLGEPFYW
ncbi:65-kDa microtubule-associated protein 1 [Camellia lanceoleosa]|uniref:65-kDa microtubule-associated protein 1 n=1 Tax=Camellia lanceoleosa TaxID=1840588 RepID=A0ACC0J384_9ERIC|nr:65-kDa microtubule-associated protein 1 [Camellia lanceoleosa]